MKSTKNIENLKNEISSLSVWNGNTTSNLVKKHNVKAHVVYYHKKCLFKKNGRTPSAMLLGTINVKNNESIEVHIGSNKLILPKGIRKVTLNNDTLEW